MSGQARPRGVLSAGGAGGAALPPRAVFAMLLLCGAWGFNMVAMKVGTEGIPPVLQAGLRSAVAAPLLLLWCRWRGVDLGGWRRDGTLLPGLAIGAVFGLEFLFLYTGLGFTTASRAVVFLYTAPFFVALGVHFLLPDDRLTPAKAAGLGVAFLGLVTAFAEGLLAPGGEATLLGDAMCLLAGALWAATTLILKATRLRSATPALALLYQLVVSAPLLLLASVLLGEGFALSLTPLVAAAFLYQAVGVAAVSYLAWFWLIARHSTSRLSAFSVLTPIFGVLAGVALLGERVGPLFGVAVALVAAGLWLVNRPDGRGGATARSA
ncbi:DMT family transporter [Craurococcus roseus]|uniref:DMT family transporter n=1 Tax=Craurococcus roseus TaxID=77585 RepID=A0ABN1FHX8_9PROT